jgi:hypothetical protein
MPDPRISLRIARAALRDADDQRASGAKVPNPAGEGSAVVLDVLEHLESADEIEVARRNELLERHVPDDTAGPDAFDCGRVRCRIRLDPDVVEAIGEEGADRGGARTDVEDRVLLAAGATARAHPIEARR